MPETSTVGGRKGIRLSRKRPDDAFVRNLCRLVASAAVSLDYYRRDLSGIDPTAEYFRTIESLSAMQWTPDTHPPASFLQLLDQGSCLLHPRLVESVSCRSANLLSQSGIARCRHRSTQGALAARADLPA